jgi:hypothetical protein
MAKKRAEEPDEVKLKKIGVKLTDQGNQEGGADLRSLKKRLKREQRKRRALVQRKKRAAGSKGAAATSA